MADPDVLVRLRRGPDGDLLVGPGPGRGAWLCPARACWDEAIRRRALSRALRGPVDASAIVARREEIAR